MKKILAIAAGCDFSRKETSLIQRRLNYLNFGLLGLCTLLKKYGNREVVMFQGEYTVERLFQTISDAEIQIERDCECVMLSIPSYYSLSWSVRFCSMLKQQCSIPIIVGGRWVVDGHKEWVFEKLKYADLIVEGFGEAFFSDYFHLPQTHMCFDGRKQAFSLLDYTILHNYRRYPPCIEVSRGCGAGCNFCADKQNRRLPNKSPDEMLCELENLDRLYGQNYSVYFEAPHFLFEPQWTDGFAYKMQQRSHRIPWRCTTRVESVPTDKRLSLLRETGLKVLDVGLESASPQQLLKMKKTSNPARYLQAAERLLEKCNEYGIWVKFNLLLYAGETRKTLEETTKWILERKDLIKSVSVSGLTHYYNMGSLKPFLALGASVPEGASLDTQGYVDLNLSPELPRDEVRRLCVQIPKLICNQRDYFDIKSICYFDNDYTYEQFLRDVDQCDPKQLPFRVEKRNAAR